MGWRRAASAALARSLASLFGALLAIAVSSTTAHAISQGCANLGSFLDNIAPFGFGGGDSQSYVGSFDAGETLTLTYTRTGSRNFSFIEFSFTPPMTAVTRTSAELGPGATNLTLTIPSTGGPYTVGWRVGTNNEFAGDVIVSVVCTAAPPPPPVDDSTTTALASSLNPSDVGESVTFTATVRSPAGTPTGTVTFLNDGATLGTAKLSAGVARLETSDLPVGRHPITARYNPTGAFDPSASPVLDQLVNADDADSERLDQMATLTTKIVAQTSGQSMQGAVDTALDDAFSGANTFTGDTTGFYMSVGGAPPSVRALDILGFDRRAGDSPADRTFSSLLGPTRGSHAADPVDPAAAGNWRVWTSARNTWWDSDVATGDVRGSQANMLVGFTYVVTPALAAGVFGGYETFEYNSRPLDARLAGSGWTGGGYLGWKFLPAYRFDVAVAGTALDYSGEAGRAAGTFAGSRLFLTTGVTGSHTLGALKIDPSVKLYALWERDRGFTDTLGTAHDDRSFSTARLSGGLKVAYPFQTGGQVAIEPFAGVYADYYFSQDDGQPTAVDAIRDGWSARFIGGLSVTSRAGVRASLTGELGGIGQGGAPHGAIRGSLGVPL